MKNIQIIDGAMNCVYDIFAATDEEFALIFPDDTDIAFIEEVFERAKKTRRNKLMNDIFTRIYKRPVKKSEAMGIHGTLFYELEYKKEYYPTRKDADARDPSGAMIR